MLATDALTPAVVQEIIDTHVGNYTTFQAAMDGVRAQGMHNAAHLMNLGCAVSEVGSCKYNNHQLLGICQA